MLTPAGGGHGQVSATVAAMLWHHVRSLKLGKTYTNETGFILRRDPDTVRAPDVAFIHRDHERSAADHRGFLPGAPDLAVEVVSPGDNRREVHAKALDWIAGGSRLVWIVWPDQRQVTVYTPPAQPENEPRTLNAEDQLTGGNVLPDFRYPVRDLFE